MSFTWSSGIGHPNRFDMTTPGHFRHRTQMAWVTFSLVSEVQDIWYANDNGVDSQWVEVGLNASNVLRVNTAVADTTIITPVASRWYHVALVINLNQWHVYIDGRLTVSIRNTATITAINCAGVGGVANGQFSLNWGGKLGEYKCWQRPLSSEEVRREMLCVYPASMHMLLGAWSFRQVTAPYGRMGQGVLTLGAGTPVLNDGVYIPTFYIPRRRYKGSAGGGTTQTQTVAGTLTPIGILARQVQKRTAGSSTPTGSLSKAVNKIVVGVMTPVGTVRKLGIKVLSGGQSLVGTLTARAIKVVTLVGSITSVGILSKAVSKSVIGVITPSGTVRKTVQKVLSGGQSLVGVVGTVAVKVVILVASLTPVGLLVKRVQVNKSGGISPVGVVVKSVSRTLQGFLTSVGSIRKQVNKILSGGISPVGSILNVGVRVLTFAGSLVPIGVIVKGVRKTLVGQVGMIGVVRKVGSKVVSGGLVSNGSVRKLVSKAVSGVMVFVGILTARGIKNIVLSGLIGLSGVVSRVFIEGGEVLAKITMYPWARRRRRKG